MTYPQSGPGYGQGDSGQPQYQQQYGQQQYGQQAGYGQQQYGQQQYGAQAGYGQQGQQYGGYQAPKPPSQGLPANTPMILAAVVGALGLITLFCGFVPGGTKSESVGAYTVEGISIELFLSAFATPWILLAAAGAVAGTTFLLGIEKWAVGVASSLSIISAVATIFIFAVADGVKIGAIILLITSILAAAASVLWLLVEGGQVQTAPAVATAGAQAAPAAADSSAYGYGQPAAQQPAAQTYGQLAQPYGQQAQATYQADPSYGQPAASHQAQPDSSPSNPAPGAPEAGPTTAFQKPDMNK
ncbi:DUF5336 domain-containing protein [Gordonia sp. (in: high G+C Gram-positive bacteria)]|uniref:DUF5336 domain-containing protein n=1 Tax=Gordonia sp. (in: high G+C Gram-positive bacteria) TaxID=84139 RepID=UPI00168E3852|nr:DUF5336 domain-containing protein [Gordonia sp. (in: high G+C Gram-positive bacteria)]NLG47630.1 34 kDa antigenic family protein [Gordonia sp. (in: high G+C Gram-positive bacteria)]